MVSTCQNTGIYSKSKKNSSTFAYLNFNKSRKLNNKKKQLDDTNSVGNSNYDVNYGYKKYYLW